MSRVVITHVGTSALKCAAIKRGDTRPSDYEQKVQEISGSEERAGPRLPGWLEALLPEWQQALREGLCAVWNDARRDVNWKRNQSPAEIASLTMMSLQRGDRVVLVSSDTNAGQFCASMLHHGLATVPAGTCDARAFRPDDLEVPEVVVLPGVETKDGSRFVAEGLPQYMRLVAAERNRMHAERDTLHFNITGGYKGIIPFAVLAAQLLGTHPYHRLSTEVVYWHAASSATLISLGPHLPMDWEKMKALHQGICTLVEHPGSDLARELDERWNPYRLTTSESHPNALALTVYHLLNDLGWV
ncbi:MAG: hypothetical protein HC884_06000 [Chloroflexaceae bacterium]|nr:hypothetical protein [Chloroflexaceae bacterium]